LISIPHAFLMSYVLLFTCGLHELSHRFETGPARNDAHPADWSHPMKPRPLDVILLAVSLPALLLLQACTSVKGDTPDGAPPPAKVVPFADAALFSVDHPEQFPLAAAAEHPTTSEFTVTGTVTPDVSRNVPVVSLASGRVMAIHTRLGDTVQKGQLLMTVRSDDVSGGYSNYKMAIADETSGQEPI
jgi:hypothetical protein